MKRECCESKAPLGTAAGPRGEEKEGFVASSLASDTKQRITGDEVDVVM